MKKPQRLICIALLTGASLLAAGASHAETIFERFAPPLLPIPVPIPVPIGGEVRISSPGYDNGYDRRRDRYERRERYDYREEYRYYPPPPPPPPYYWHHYHEPRYYGPPPRRW